VATYLFEHTWEQERHRLDVLEQVFDPPTCESLGRIPIPPGARCLEIGAGAGSIAQWLCDRVGPDGRVVATDLDTDFLETLTEKNLEIRRHDIVSDEVEEGAFDLVHSRLVLDHLPGREQVIHKMAAAVRPGGWLVLESFDWSSLVTAPGCTSGDLMARIHEAMRIVFPVGAPECGRLLPATLHAAGLVDVAAAGRVHVGIAGTPAAAWWQLSLAALHQPLLATGRFTEPEVDEAIRACEADGFCIFLPALITAWGRRPLE